MTPWAGAAPTTPVLGLVLIPSGKHAAFRDWDARSSAHCIDDGGYCPCCEPHKYAQYDAKRRADVAA